ncbi:hypothetical protein [Amycolatopsis plumensis]|uniref:hypothetical protein n=1 Tax=Amycolatopsis plumensis TaxID=236508 RepID=UPI003621F4BD
MGRAPEQQSIAHVARPGGRIRWRLTRRVSGRALARRPAPAVCATPRLAVRPRG